MDKVNPLEILGKNFLEIQNLLEHNGIEEIVEDTEETGEEQQYCVSAKDGTWEISLGKNNKVETIFLHLNNGYSGILGITRSMNSEAIVKLMGEPTKIGEKRVILILGEYGAWERYDRDNYCIHIQHNLENTEVEQITIMLPEIAP